MSYTYFKITFGRTAGTPFVELRNLDTNNYSRIQMGFPTGQWLQSAFISTRTTGYRQSVLCFFYKNISTGNFSYHDFPDTASAGERVSVEVVVDSNYGGANNAAPFYQNGTVSFKPLVKAEVFSSTAPSTTSNGLKQVNVAPGSETYVLHVNNSTQNTTSSWFPGYYGKISNSNLPLCVTTLFDRGAGGIGSQSCIVVEMIGSIANNDYNSSISQSYGAKTVESGLVQLTKFVPTGTANVYRDKITSTAMVATNDTAPGEAVRQTVPYSMYAVPTICNFVYVVEGMTPSTTPIPVDYSPKTNQNDQFTATESLKDLKNIDASSKASLIFMGLSANPPTFSTGFQ